jgi:hypothetical protein
MRANLQERQRYHLLDLILVWGFLLFFAALLGAGGYEAWKIVSVIPAAFQSSPGDWSNPMGTVYGGQRPNPYGGKGATSRQRAQQQDR